MQAPRELASPSTLQRGQRSSEPMLPFLLCLVSAYAERCFLSHSPALRPWIVLRRLRYRTAAVLRGGALEPNARALVSAERLSLSGGASSLARSSSSCASPFCLVSCNFCSKTKKATLRVALASSCHAARKLARTPPSEGMDASGPAILVFEDVPARQRRGRHRFGQKLICGDSHVHWYAASQDS